MSIRYPHMEGALLKGCSGYFPPRSGEQRMCRGSRDHMMKDWRMVQTRRMKSVSRVALISRKCGLRGKAAIHAAAGGRVPRFSFGKKSQNDCCGGRAWLM